MSIPKSKIINDNAKEIGGFIKAIIQILFSASALTKYTVDVKGIIWHLNKSKEKETYSQSKETGF